jgi:hypothetical protein
VSPVGPPHAPCEPVEAYINVFAPGFPPVGSRRPVFYRCYWKHAHAVDLYDVVAFEWSATTEYIDWWITNHPNTNIPLLTVTNHSPSS